MPTKKLAQSKEKSSMKTASRIFLREYQSKAVDDCLAAMHEGKSTLLVSPTGAGKTLVAARIARQYSRVLFLAHRQEIIEQAKEVMGRKVHAMSVQSVLRHGPQSTDLLIIDEAHRSAADTYRKIIERYFDAARLGLTATPLRTDGQGLCDAYSEMVVSSNVQELVDLGYLVPYRAFEAPDSALDELASIRKLYGDYKTGELSSLMNRPRLIGNVVSEYKKHALGRKAVVFAVSIEHSKALATAFRSAGIRAVHLDGRASEKIRRLALASLSDGQIDVLCNVNLFTEGWDCPAVSCVVLARPTLSLTLHLQCIGRGMRPSEGKDDLIILDHAGNLHRLGAPDEEREWSLESKSQKEKREAEIAELERLHSLGYESIAAELEEKRRINCTTYSRTEVIDKLAPFVQAKRKHSFSYFLKTIGVSPSHSLRQRSRLRFDKTQVDECVERFELIARTSYTREKCSKLLGLSRSPASTMRRLGVGMVKLPEFGPTVQRYDKGDVDRLVAIIRQSYTSKQLAVKLKIYQCNVVPLLHRHGIKANLRVKNTYYYSKSAVDALLRNRVLMYGSPIYRRSGATK